MYAKVFRQIFDSTLANDPETRHIFMDLLVLADRMGYVDMTPDAIARRTNIPQEKIEAAMQKLSQPDRDSRSTEEDGRRIIFLDEHRGWGWRIVNYQQYRGMHDEDARREYFTSKKREQRAGISGRRRGYVYYADGDAGIKIGFSANPWARINEMRVACPSLKILATETGDEKLEKLRHVQFSCERIDREWFKKSTSLLSHIASLATNNYEHQSKIVAATMATSTQAEAEAEADTEAKIKTSYSNRKAAGTIPLNTGKQFTVYEDQVAQWIATYPAVDVRQQLREIRAWSDANPSKRKTNRGVLRFVNAWLAKEQDKPSGGKSGHFESKTQQILRKAEQDLAAQEAGDGSELTEHNPA